MNKFPFDIILASKSPRRSEILTMANIPFSIKTKEVEEDYPDDLPVDYIPEFLAKKKAEALSMDIHPGQVVLASDTIVVLDGEVLGKPKDRDDAISMLSKMSFREHQVITGVCLLDVDKQYSFIDTASVFLYGLSQQEIEFYVDTFKPYDKAGAYGVQEWLGMCKVEKIEGSFYTIMGLPIGKLYHALEYFQTL